MILLKIKDLIFGLLISFQILAYAKDSSLKNLTENLINDYKTDLIPLCDEDSNLQVKLDMTISQILEVNDQRETITISGWLNLEWFDFNLIWDPSLYNGIKKIYVPVENIWKPDIFLYNGADKDSWNVWSTSNVLAHVSNNGTVRVSPPSITISFCPLNIFYFPFDEKNCNLTFGSWAYTIDVLNLTILNKVYLDSYKINGGWDLKKASLRLEYKRYEDQPNDLYSLISIQLNLSRRTLFYTFNLVFPCLLITTLSIYGYTLPSESGEKVGLQITILLAIVFFIQYISSITPPSNGISRLAIFLMLMSILSSISVIGNVYVLNLQYTDIRLEKPMPIWFEKLVCHYIAKLLKIKDFKIRHSKEDDTEEDKKETLSKSSSGVFIPILDQNGRHTLYKEAKLNMIYKINQNVEFIKKQMEENNLEEEKRLKWKFAALVIDKLFLYLSILFFLFFFITFFSSTPHMF